MKESGPSGWKNVKRKKKPVKRKRERDEQMEWAGTILVHDGIISMWLQYVTDDTVYTSLTH